MSAAAAALRTPVADRSPWDPVRVMIVDDDAFYRKVLAGVIENIHGAELAGMARSGEDALQKLATTPVDLMLLDVEMPGMNGVQTLVEARRRFPRTSVVMVSGASAADLAMRAVEAGALDFVAKPSASTSQQSRQILVRDVRAFVINVAGRLVRERLEARANGRRVAIAAAPAPAEARAAPVPASRSAPARLPARFGLVAIGSSTGGPAALMQVLPRLRAGFPLPVVVVQHMPADFTASLARQLNARCPLDVKEAEAGDVLVPGQVLLAKGGSHMELQSGLGGVRVVLTDGPLVHGVRPSVDVLFASIARVHDQPVLSSILTGMGRDGLSGVQALRRRGCWCIAQDEESCVVYGMPRAVVDAGEADQVMSLEQIGHRLDELGRRGGRG